MKRKTNPGEDQHRIYSAGVVSMAKPPKCFATHRHGESYGVGTGERVASGESSKEQFWSKFTTKYMSSKLHVVYTPNERNNEAGITVKNGLGVSWVVFPVHIPSF